MPPPLLRVDNLEDYLRSDFDSPPVDAGEDRIRLGVTGWVKEGISKPSLSVFEISRINVWEIGDAAIIAIKHVICDSAELNSEPFGKLHILEQRQVDSVDGIATL